MSTVLTDVAAEIRNREDNKPAQFQELVAAVVAGDVEPGQVVEALTELGKTLGELQTAVGYAEQRKAWRAEADQIRSLESERAELQRVIDNEERSYKELTERYTATIGPLRDREYQLQRRLSAAYAACRTLRKGYRGPLTAELAAIHEQGRQLADELAGIKEARGRTNWWLSGPPMIRASVKPEQQRKLRARLTAADERIAQLESAISENRRQGQEVERAMLQS